jgi:MFS transporter, DHA1 family, inner membrane transport protein
MSKKERIIIFLLAALNFTHILDFMIMMPLSNYLMPYFDISPHQFSLLVGSYSLSAFFSGILLAFIVDQHDRKKVLVYVYIGFLLGTIACGLAPSYGLLMIARVVAGLFGGIIGGQVFSIIADLFPYERRGMAVGSVMSAFAVASIIGVPVSLYLTNLFHYNWHVPFLMVGGLGFLLVPAIIKILPPLTEHITVKKEGQSRFEALLKVFQNPYQGMALLFTMLMMLGHFLIIPFLNPYMEFNRGYSKSQIPMVYLVGGIASLLSAIYLGKVSDNLGKFRIFTFTVLCSLVMVFGITNMPAIPFSLVLVFFAVWFVFATGRGVTAQAMVTNVVEKDQQGSFMVLNSSMQHAGTFLASIISGYIVIESKNGKIQRYEWVGYLSILVLLACFLLGRYLFRHMDKKRSS